MHSLQRLSRYPLSDALEVNHLPAAHPDGAACPRKFGHHRNARSVRNRKRRQKRKRKRLQRVTGEHRLRLTKLHVAGGFAAPKGIVIHGRQIIVHERIRVHRLNRKSRGVKGRARGLREVPCGVDKKRTHAFTAAQDRVAHGLPKF